MPTDEYEKLMRNLQPEPKKTSPSWAVTFAAFLSVGLTLMTGLLAATVLAYPAGFIAHLAWKIFLAGWHST